MEMTDQKHESTTVGFDGEIVWRPLDARTYARMRAVGEIYTREIEFKHEVGKVHYIGVKDIIAHDDEWVLCEGKLPTGLKFDRGFIYDAPRKIGEYDLRYRVLMKNIGIYEVRVHISVVKFRKPGWDIAGTIEMEERAREKHPEK